MKILYLIDSAGMGGAETCLFRLVTGIRKTTSHDIVVINTEDGELNDRLRSIGIRIYVYPSVRARKFYRRSQVLRLARNVLGFKRLARMEKPDVIHAFTVPSYRRIFLFRLIGIRTQVIGTIHDALDPGHFGALKTRFFVYVMNHIHRYIIAVSRSTQQIAINNGVKKEKLCVIYNGIPDDSDRRPRSVTRSKAFVVGCFGRITPSKGQHVLIESIEFLLKKIKNLQCIIVGKPSVGIKGSTEYYESIRKDVVAKGYQGIIQLCDWTEDIGQFYQRLDVYVLTSVNADSFPTVILEAMLYSLPVVAVDIGGSQEQVVDGVTGFIVEPGKPHLLAEKILWLYEHPKEALAMGEKGYERVTACFNMVQYVDGHLRLYQVLHSRR